MRRHDLGIEAACWMLCLQSIEARSANTHPFRADDLQSDNHASLLKLLKLYVHSQRTSFLLRDLIIILYPMYTQEEENPLFRIYYAFKA